MALQDILKKIIADAEKEAKKIAAKNAERLKEVQKHLQQQLQEEDKKSAMATKQRQEAMDRKVEAHGQMETKMGIVAMKTDLLNAVKGKALEAIRKLPEAERVKMFSVLLKRISEEGVVHPAKGQEEILKKALHESKKSFQIGKEVEIPDGFLFTGEKVDVDANFESLLEKEIFPAVEAELSKILFSE